MSPALADTVLRSASTLGYQINLVGRALRTQRTGTIGLLIPDLTNPYFSQLAESLNKHVSEGGSELLVASSRGSTVVEQRLVESLIGQQIDGLVVIPCDENESASHISEASSRVPTIQIDRKADRRTTYYIGTDSQVGFQLIADHITAVNMSHQAPVIYIGADLHIPSAKDRLEAFTKHFPDSLTLLGDYSLGWGYDACTRILNAGIGEGIIVASADIIAFGAINSLTKASLRIPDDFRIIGYDGAYSDLSLHPSLTTVIQPVDSIAQHAWRALEDQSAFEIVSRDVRIPPWLSIGTSSPENHNSLK